MVMPLEIKKLEKPGEIILECIGAFDETANLPYINSVNRVIINLHKTTTINSIGIRHFIQWGANHIHVSSILLEGCPAIFAKNFSAVLGFLKPNMAVMSFYVPYYSPETQETTDVLLTQGKEFQLDGSLALPVVKDSENKEMELDVIKDIFFRFLKK